MLLISPEEFVLPAITVESLKEDKGYNKAAKKYIKEHDGLMKKLTKERTNIASNQCKAMEKLAKSKKWVCTQNVVMGQVYPDLQCNSEYCKNCNIQ